MIRLHGFFNKPELLGSRPSASALHRRDHFNTGTGNVRVRRHSRIHRRTPMPYRAMPDCPVETGCSSEFHRELLQRDHDNGELAVKIARNV